MCIRDRAHIRPSYDYKNFTFAIDAAYLWYNNDFLPFGKRVSDSQLETGRFGISFEDREAIRLSPSVSFVPTDDIKLNLSYTHDFFVDAEVAPSYKPQWTVALAGEQSLVDDKLIFTQSVSWIGPRIHWSGVDSPTADNAVDLGTYLDVGLGVRYNVSEAFSLYVEGVNLFPNRTGVTTSDDFLDSARLWQGYPVLQRQVWGGLKFRF